MTVKELRTLNELLTRFLKEHLHSILGVERIHYVKGLVYTELKQYTKCDLPVACHHSSHCYNAGRVDCCDSMRQQDIKCLQFIPLGNDKL